MNRELAEIIVKHVDGGGRLVLDEALPDAVWHMEFCQPDVADGVMLVDGRHMSVGRLVGFRRMGDEMTFEFRCRMKRDDFSGIWHSGQNVETAYFLRSRGARKEAVQWA